MKLYKRYHRSRSQGRVHYRGSIRLQAQGIFFIKRTYQPKKRYRRRVHGFLRRMSTKGGARLVSNRRRKGRHRLTP